LVLVICLVPIVCLAYVGVRFADKPVTWMPTALSLCTVPLIVGLVWAYHPVFSRMESTIMRYTAQIAATILSIIFAVYLGYVLFVNMWLLFGGGL
jgi:hypothetical protein